jgi:hypothetical protein
MQWSKSITSKKQSNIKRNRKIRSNVEFAIVFLSLPELAEEIQAIFISRPSPFIREPARYHEANVSSFNHLPLITGNYI